MTWARWMLSDLLCFVAARLSRVARGRHTPELVSVALAHLAGLLVVLSCVVEPDPEPVPPSTPDDLPPNVVRLRGDDLPPAA